MHRVNRYIASIFLTAALVAPVATMAAPGPQATVQIRVYDSGHKDYHYWDDHEDHAYRGYLEEHHMTYHVYAKQNHKTQTEYWNWRHSHPD